MSQFVVENIPDAFEDIREEVIEEGRPVRVRDEKTFELQNVHITAKDPSKRIVPDYTDWETLAVELASLRTATEPATDPSEDVQDQLDLLSSFYGDHMRSQFERWATIRKRFEEDIHTRKGTFVFWDSEDPSCTTRLQLMFRDGELNCYVYERSNDVHWAFPIDTAVYQTIHHQMAQELEVTLGKYHHNATSFHIYDDKV